MEIVGVEPTTLCLQSRCSSQLSYTPFFSFLLDDNCVRLHLLPPHNHKVAASVGVRLPCSRRKINFKFFVSFGRSLRWTAYRRSVIYSSKLPPFSLVRLDLVSKQTSKLSDFQNYELSKVSEIQKNLKVVLSRLELLTPTLSV